jgi:hypothetical protein
MVKVTINGAAPQRRQRPRQPVRREPDVLR